MNVIERQILQNVAGLVSKAVALDKEVMTAVAAYRGGVKPGSDRNEVQGQIDMAF